MDFNYEDEERKKIFLISSLEGVQKKPYTSTLPSVCFWKL